jgi:hypothetical protein
MEKSTDGIDMKYTTSEVTSDSQATIVHSDLVALYQPTEQDPDLGVMCQVEGGPYPSLGRLVEWALDPKMRVLEVRDESDKFTGITILKGVHAVAGWCLTKDMTTIASEGVRFLHSEGIVYCINTNVSGVEIRDYFLRAGEIGSPWDPRTYADEEHGGLTLEDLKEEFTLTVTVNDDDTFSWIAELK